jgi:thioredoxin 1
MDIMKQSLTDITNFTTPTIITTALQFIKQNPTTLLIIFMILKRILSRSSTFPTVDYGHVETISDADHFADAILNNFTDADTAINAINANNTTDTTTKERRGKRNKRDDEDKTTTAAATATAATTKPVLTVIDYYATWCPPCKSAVPVFAKMSEDYKSRNVAFYKCDVDKQKSIASEQGIRAMPTFKIYKNGECVETVQGFNEKGIREGIERHL